MDNFVLETIRSRRAVRKYSDESVTQSQLDALIEAALISPSAVNHQPWHISAITNKDIILELEKDIIDYYIQHGPEDLADMNAKRDNKIFYNAPVVFVITHENNDYSSIDIGIVAQSIAIAAKSMGLDSVILGLPRVAFGAESTKNWEQRLGAPTNYVYGISIAVGHGEDKGRDRQPDMSKLSLIK